ncbi:LD-carboxypeptidase [candidate division KSB1 bacterium]|nr:LD-carboxypeptidase [candidate division KSB1 bacterium]
MKSNITRRRFIGEVSAIGTAAALAPGIAGAKSQSQKIIKPPALSKGDTVGLITPASGIFDPQTIREGRETLDSLGFNVKFGKNISRRYGYLAGSDEERAADLHEMFRDDEVKAIVALRGGYGSMRLLQMLDYDLIRENPKILLGYSDITSLHLAIHAMTGLVTFHGPVAISSFTEYTQNYFFKITGSKTAIGEIAHPKPESELSPTAHFFTINGGFASGRLIGGNLTLMTALLGTPYEFDTAGKILFIEEVGEEPYSIDRMLTQLLLAGKLDNAAGIIIDRCSRCGPSDYKPAFINTLSVEEVFIDRLKHLDIPIVFGFSIGHVANKPTLPLGIEVTLDATNHRLRFKESAIN